MTSLELNQLASLCNRRTSPAQMRAHGWTRIDPRPWTKVRARWVHVGGWRLEHCGHPTALNPWALFAPTGEMHCLGALFAKPPNPAHGMAWPNLALAIAYVARAATSSRRRIRKEGAS